jgi:hypothetical protein
MLLAGILGLQVFFPEWEWPALFIPYSTLEIMDSVDSRGRPCTVKVETKPVGWARTRGPRPRVRVTTVGEDGSSRVVYDSDHWWGAHVISVRPVPGGIDVYADSNHRGGMSYAARFEVGPNGVESPLEDVAGTPVRRQIWLSNETPLELHELLAKINSVSKMEGSRFDPVALIQTVNALRAAG